MDTQCSRCGRPLIDPWSIKAGIGPICIKRALTEIFDRRGQIKPKTNYTIVEQDATKVVIRDIGPWDQFMTVTNGAESVVAELAPMLGNRRLFNINSENGVDELKYEGDVFRGFKFVESDGSRGPKTV
jgi:hypothetical protein